MNGRNDRAPVNASRRYGADPPRGLLAKTSKVEMKATREIINHVPYAAERDANPTTKPPCLREKGGRNENFIKNFDDEQRPAALTLFARRARAPSTQKLAVYYVNGIFR